MYEVTLLLILGFVYLAIASIQDIKKREVANWLSFSLIIFALAYRIFYSAFMNDWNFLVMGIIGLVIFVGLGFGLYYGRFFAGGDAKLIMGIGLVITVYSTWQENTISIITFIALMLLSGAVYGGIFSLALALKSKNNFKKEFSKLAKEKWGLIQLTIFLGIISLIVVFLTKEWSFLLLPVLIFILPWIYIYAKSVDEGCMIFQTPIEELTEGDWLYKDVELSKEKIKANWEGLSKEEIELIKKSKIKTVLVRRGIPFVPAIFIAFIIWLYLFLWNPLLVNRIFFL